MNDLHAALEEATASAPIDRANWDDVVARARRSVRTRVIIAGVTATAILGIATPALGLDARLIGLFDGAPVDPKELSRQELHALGAMSAGESPRLAASAEETLARVGAANLRRIATRDGRSYYVANHTSGGLCVTVAAATDPNPFSEYLCSPDFPTPDRPVLDQSTFTGPPSVPTAQRLEGFAADGVAAVQLVTTSGSRVTVEVTDNIYARTHDLPDEPVREIVALDGAGSPIHTILCATHEPCVP